MRKMIFTFMLTIVSSVWTMSSALCIARAPQMQQSTETLSGYFVMEGTPCESTVEPCLPCLTLAFQSNETLYYLTSDNDQMMSQLNEIEAQFIEGQHATINGISYQQGSYNYINVQTVSIANSPLPSLCDEWNVLSHSMSLGPEYESFKTLHFRLTSDTIINETRYVKLEQNGTYKGALREGSNADIYYVPNNSTHEYLLYAFNAQVGDSLKNLWYGANEIDRFIINSATVVNIESTTPRKFTIDFEWQSIYSYAAINDTSEITHTELVWLEGLGFQYGGPLNYECPFDCAGAPGMLILCAYKNGEQVYVSEMGEQYGCEYDYDPYSTPGDTIPLFVQDDPGSSTVDPVDPNQVVATLQGNQLTIHENMGVDITYSLQHNAPAQTPAQHRAPQNDTFRNEVTIQITESGEYLLQLTNPSWGYTIFGRFNYSPQGIEITNDQSSIINKVIRDGRLLILRGDKTYTLTGQEVR